MNNRASGEKKKLQRKKLQFVVFIFTGGQNENTFSVPLVCRRRVVLPNVTSKARLSVIAEVNLPIRFMFRSPSPTMMTIPYERNFINWAIKQTFTNV